MRGYNLAITEKKFDGNTLRPSLQYKNMAKSFRVGYFFDSAGMRDRLGNAHM